MILREGFSEKKCHLMDGKVMIDGIETPIGKIQEIQDYQFRCNIALILLMLTGVLAGYLFYGAFIEGNKANHSMGIIVIILGVILYLGALRSLLRNKRYYSCWKVDSSISNYILVEKSDGEIIHNMLKAIESDHRADA